MVCCVLQGCLIFHLMRVFLNATNVGAFHGMIGYLQVLFCCCCCCISGLNIAILFNAKNYDTNIFSAEDALVSVWGNIKWSHERIFYKNLLYCSGKRAMFLLWRAIWKYALTKEEYCVLSRTLGTLPYLL